MTNAKRPFCQYSNDYAVWTHDLDENGRAVSMSCTAAFRYFQEALDYVAYCVKAGCYVVWRFMREDGTYKTSSHTFDTFKAGHYFGHDHTGYGQRKFRVPETDFASGKPKIFAA